MDQGEVMRLTALSERQLFIDNLQSDHGLTPVEADVLHDRVTTFSQMSHPDSRAHDQIIVTAVRKGELAGIDRPRPPLGQLNAFGIHFF